MIGNVFVLTPAYNAESTLDGVYRRFPAAIRDRITRYVAVDDGSTDRTGEVLDRIAASEPKLTVLRHAQNGGYGAAQKTLLRHAMERDAEVMILVHADGQYSPECIPEILDLFDRDQAELVQGSRMLGGGALEGGMPFYKYVANKGLTSLENRVFGMKMAEYHSGYMVYSRRLIEAVPFEKLSDSFDFDLEMILAAKILGHRIREVAIPTIYADEVSNLNPIRYGLDVLAIVRRYRKGYYHRLLGADSEG
jgi:glycosyltransferase involved in cell wall biosynthesis